MGKTKGDVFHAEKGRLADLELPPSAVDPGLRDADNATPSWGVRGFGGAGGVSADSCDPALREDYPRIHQFLTQSRWGGVTRKTGTLLVFCDDCKFKVCLNDRETGMSAFLSFGSILEALDGLEKALTIGDLDWRTPKWKKK